VRNRPELSAGSFFRKLPVASLHVGSSSSPGSQTAEQENPETYSSTIGERVKTRRAEDRKRRAEERVRRDADFSLEDEPGANRREDGHEEFAASGDGEEEIGMPVPAVENRMEDRMDETGEMGFEEAEVLEDDDGWDLYE
jgi:hypothetical protein